MILNRVSDVRLPGFKSLSWESLLCGLPWAGDLPERQCFIRVMGVSTGCAVVVSELVPSLRGAARCTVCDKFRTKRGNNSYVTLG